MLNNSFAPVSKGQNSQYGQTKSQEATLINLGLEQSDLKNLSVLLQNNQMNKFLALFFKQLSFSRKQKKIIFRYNRRKLKPIKNINKIPLKNHTLTNEQFQSLSIIRFVLENFEKYSQAKHVDILQQMYNRYLFYLKKLQIGYDQRQTLTNLYRNLKNQVGINSMEQLFRAKPNESIVKLSKLFQTKLNQKIGYLYDKNQNCQISQSYQLLTQSNNKIFAYSCLNCISYLYQYTNFYIPPQFNNNEGSIQFINNLQMPKGQIQGEYRDAMQKTICAMLNSGGKGYIFIGILSTATKTSFSDCLNKKHYVKGIKVTNDIIKKLSQQLKNLIDKYIRPRNILQQAFALNPFQQCFKISYIPVLTNPMQFLNKEPDFNFSDIKKMQDKISSSQLAQKLFQGLFVIRIKVDFQKLNHKYMFYITTPSFSGDKQIDYTFCQYNKQQAATEINSSIRAYQIKGGQIYNKIVKKYQKQIKQQRYNSYSILNIYKHQKFIKCLQPLKLPQQIYKKLSISFGYQQGNVDKDQINFKQKIENIDRKGNKKYGNVPHNKYKHQSLLLLSPKAINSFNKFIGVLKEKRIGYDCYCVYQKLSNHDSSRQAYYLTHQKKYEVIHQILEQIDKNKTQIMLLDIRKQFVLLNSDQSGYSLKYLLSVFKNQFTANIACGEKENYDPKQKKAIRQFYYVFHNTIYAIFAFVALQYKNIKCNFVNFIKTNGANIKEY